MSGYVKAVGLYLIVVILGGAVLFGLAVYVRWTWVAHFLAKPVAQSPVLGYFPPTGSPHVEVQKFSQFLYEPTCRDAHGRMLEPARCLSAIIRLGQPDAAIVRKWFLLDAPGLLSIESIGKSKFRIHIRDPRHVRCD